MKKILLLILPILMSFPLYAKKSKPVAKEKTYTQAELDNEVEKQVIAKLNKMRGSKIVQFSKDLLKKEKVLKLEKMKLRQREEQLRQGEKDFEKKLTEFLSRQSKFLGCIDEINEQDKKRTSHMVDVIAGMRPKNAADVLSVQDPALSVKILGLLAPEKVSKIFNLMDKAISARLQKQYMNMKK